MDRTAGRAVVIGAGIGGIAAAAALKTVFDDVILIERDTLATDGAPRAGAPQGRHVHGLLAGGLRALDGLLPGLEVALCDAGASVLNVGLDIRNEQPGFDPYPQRDLGLQNLAMSRPLLEQVALRLLRGAPGVRILDRCRAQKVLTGGDGRVAGVMVRPAGGASHDISADLIVDCSGQARLSLDLLKALGAPPVEELSLLADVGYASACFAQPDETPSGWKGVMCFPDAPRSTLGGLLMPMEGRRWVVTLFGRGNEKPSDDWAAFQAALRQLRTPTIADAVAKARRLSGPVRFAMPQMRWRRFDRLRAMPSGLMVLGDGISQLLPMYGQGMTVAALEAVLLHDAARSAGGPDWMADLTRRYYAGLEAIVSPPWTTAYGQQTATFSKSAPAFNDRSTPAGALTLLAAEDREAHLIVARLQHFLTPLEAVQADLYRRILAFQARSTATASGAPQLVGAAP